jgi:hypothetical protein
VENGFPYRSVWKVNPTADNTLHVPVCGEQLARPIVKAVVRFLKSDWIKKLSNVYEVLLLLLKLLIRNKTEPLTVLPGPVKVVVVQKPITISPTDPVPVNVEIGFAAAVHCVVLSLKRISVLRSVVGIVLLLKWCRYLRPE